MRKNAFYQYYVEGQDEKKLLDTLKTEMQCIHPGKVEIFNVIHEVFNDSYIRPLKNGTIAVLIYDTDVEETEKLCKNIEFLRKQKPIKDVLCVPQVKNLEAELVNACSFNNVKELTHSKTKKEFKRDFLHCTNLKDRLEKCNFDFSKFWSNLPKNQFSQFGNDSEQIRLKGKGIKG